MHAGSAKTAVFTVFPMIFDTEKHRFKKREKRDKLNKNDRGRKRSHRPAAARRGAARQTGYRFRGRGEGMQLEHYRYLIYINPHRSISAAAAALHVGQTTLSAALKSVEDELGFPVFKRTPAGVTPTAKGLRVLDLAWEITTRYDALLTMKDRTGEPPHLFGILVSPVVPIRILTEIADGFYQFQVPGNIGFREYKSMDIADRVVAREAGIGVGFYTRREIHRLREMYAEGELRIQTLYQDEMNCITPVDGPLAEAPYATVEDLLRVTLVLPYAPLESGTGIENMSSRLVNYSVLPDIALLLQGVAGYGFTTLLPRYSISMYDQVDAGSYRALPIRDADYDSIIFLCLLTLPEDQLDQEQKKALSCVRDVFQRYRPETEERGRVSEEADR